MCECAFADKFDAGKKRYFPPTLDLLLSWTTMFRSGRTLRNYLGYVQTGCLLAGASTQVECVSACSGLKNVCPGDRYSKMQR